MSDSEEYETSQSESESESESNSTTDTDSASTSDSEEDESNDSHSHSNTSSSDSSGSSSSNSTDTNSSSDTDSNTDTDSDTVSQSDDDTDDDIDDDDDMDDMDDDEKVNQELQIRSKRYQIQNKQRHNKIQLLISSYCLSIITRKKHKKKQNKIRLFDIIPLSIMDLILHFHGKYYENIYIGIGQCGLQIMSSSSSIPASSTLYIDSEPIEFNKMINAKNAIFGTGSYENNWAEGYYGKGSGFVEQCFLNDMRLQMERDDNLLKGIEIIHSIGGGTGSGMGCLIMEKIRDLYEKLIISSFTIFPSMKVSDIVVEPYNALLSMHKFEDCLHQIFTIDNEKLYDITTNKLKRRNAKYCDLNSVANTVINNIRPIWKYSHWNIVDINTELKKNSERLKYFVMSSLPLSKSQKMDNFIDVYNWYNLYEDTNCLTTINGHYDGKLISSICSMQYSQKLNVEKLMNKVLKIEARMSLNGVIDRNCYLNPTFINIKPEIGNYTISMIGNHTGIINMFERLLWQYRKMWKRRAFLHWYKGIGMIDDEFIECEENMESLIDQYKNI